MKKLQVISAVMALIITVTVIAVCSQSVSAHVTDESEIGFTGSGDDDYPFEDPTGHCTDWANYTIRQESNYCTDNEVCTGNYYGEHTLSYTAPEDLEIVSFKFTLYHEYEGVTLGDFTTFTPMECETADNDIWMMKGSFADASPVTVKKGEPLVTADIKIDVGSCYYGDMTGVKTVVYLSADELQVMTAEGYRVIIGDENTTQPGTYDPYGPTGNCTIDPVIATSSPAVATEPAEPTEPSYQVIIGDVNDDGSIDVLDALDIEKYAVEKIQLTPEQIYAADVNGDGVADTLDSVLIQKYTVDKINGFSK